MIDAEQELAKSFGRALRYEISQLARQMQGETGEKLKHKKPVPKSEANPTAQFVSSCDPEVSQLGFAEIALQFTRDFLTQDRGTTTQFLDCVLQGAGPSLSSGLQRGSQRGSTKVRKQGQVKLLLEALTKLHDPDQASQAIETDIIDASYIEGSWPVANYFQQLVAAARSAPPNQVLIFVDRPGDRVESIAAAETGLNIFLDKNPDLVNYIGAKIHRSSSEEIKAATSDPGVELVLSPAPGNIYRNSYYRVKVGLEEGGNRQEVFALSSGTGSKSPEVRHKDGPLAISKSGLAFVENKGMDIDARRFLQAAKAFANFSIKKFQAVTAYAGRPVEPTVADGRDPATPSPVASLGSEEGGSPAPIQLAASSRKMDGR